MCDNITPIAKATRTEDHRRHARSRIAGRLFAIFEQLCAATREARESGEDLNDPTLRDLGGENHVAEGSPLHESMMAVCQAAMNMLRTAEPDDYPEQKPIGKRK